MFFTCLKFHTFALRLSALNKFNSFLFYFTLIAIIDNDLTYVFVLITIFFKIIMFVNIFEENS